MSPNSKLIVDGVFGVVPNFREGLLRKLGGGLTQMVLL